MVDFIVSPLFFSYLHIIQTLIRLQHSFQTDKWKRTGQHSVDLQSCWRSNINIGKSLECCIFFLCDKTYRNHRDSRAKTKLILMLALKETHYRFVMRSDPKACEYNNVLLSPWRYTYNSVYGLNSKISCLVEDEPDDNILHFFFINLQKSNMFNLFVEVCNRCPTCIRSCWESMNTLLRSKTSAHTTALTTKEKVCMEFSDRGDAKHHSHTLVCWWGCKFTEESDRHGLTLIRGH